MNGYRKIETNWDGSVLTKWRKENKISVPVLSERTGIPVATLYRYESGYVPTIERAHRLVRVTKGGVRYRDMYPGFEPRYA